MFKQMGWNFHLLFYYSVNIKVAYGVFDIVADFCILSIAIKFTINRLKPSGSFGEGDIFGCQQYAPLLDVEIPVEE